MSKFDPTEAQLEAIADRVAAILHARQHPQRDLAAEIGSWLADHQPATVPEIAYGITARESTVRQTLAADDRFQTAPRPPGRSPRTKCWLLTTQTGSTQPRPRRSGSGT